METKITVQEPSLCKRLLEIVVPVEKTEEERAKALKKIRKMAAVPGFRPGKAPDTLLERYCRKAIMQEILETSVEQAVPSALESQGLKPLGEPRLTKSEFDLGQPIELTFEFEVMPAVELKPYGQLEIPYAAESFDESSIDKELEILRERRARMEDVEGSAAEKGCLLEVDVEFVAEGESESVELKSVRHLFGQAGPNSFLDDAVAGKVKGDEARFEHEFGADYYDPRLAGKKGAGTIRIVNITRRVLPELDDAFAKENGDFATMAELRQEIEQNLRLGLEEDNRARLENAVMERLVSDYDFEVPEVLVDNLFRERASGTVDFMLSRGMSEEHISNINWKEMRQKDDESLRRTVRRMIVVDKIAEAEKVSVSEEEVEAAIVKRAETAKVSVDDFKKYFVKNEEAMSKFQERLRITKVLDLIIATAAIVPPKAEPAEEKHEHAEGCGCPEHSAK